MSFQAPSLQDLLLEKVKRSRDMDQLVQPGILVVLSSIPYIMAKEREGKKNFFTFHIKKKNLGNFGHK